MRLGEEALSQILRWRQVCWLCLACGVGIGTLAMGVEAPPAGAQVKAPQVKPPEVKPPDRWTLPVPLRAQETELWCWAATGQMTMEYLGTGVSQSDQVNR